MNGPYDKRAKRRLALNNKTVDLFSVGVLLGSRVSGAAIAPPPSLMDLDIPTPDFVLQKQADGEEQDFDTIYRNFMTNSHDAQASSGVTDRRFCCDGCPSTSVVCDSQQRRQ